MEDTRSCPSESASFGNVCKELPPEHIAKLKKEHNKGLAFCLEKTQQWEKFKKDYEVLNDRLETLPDRISHDIMVPFGSLAFMPGKLVCTNEIMVLLGANWFAEVSAKHAVEISQRRINQCVRMLEDLKKEKEQFESWLKYINEVTGADLIDLTEHLTEEEYQKHKAQHSKNVKAYHQKQKSVPDEKCVSEYKKETAEVNKDYFRILDEHEENEASLGEMNDYLELDVDEDGHDSEGIDDSSESSDEDESDDKDSSDEHSKSNEKHVKWKDQEGEKMKNCITFTHSSRKCKSKPMPINKSKSKSKESGSLSPIKIQSPSDIYKCFSTKPEQSKPKSILKRTSSVDDTDASSESLNESAPMKKLEDMPILPTFKSRLKEQMAFTGEVIEREANKDSTSEKSKNDQRPPSKFKAQRQNRRS